MKVNEFALKILAKKAKGYAVKERVDEYAVGEDGQMRLVKRKITTKQLPADAGALKILVETGVEDVDKMSDEQLQKEKERLLKLLKDYSENEIKEETNA